jgi:hypothetical protein
VLRLGKTVSVIAVPWHQRAYEQLSEDTLQRFHFLFPDG